jgi:hypothetical protein
MVEPSANHKKIVGNVCLHRELLPQRRFLRRNLRHILDSHENLIQRAITSNDPSSVSKLDKDMSTNGKRILGFDYPTREMLEDLMKGRKPIVRIVALQIREKGSKMKAANRLSRVSGDGDGFDFIPSSDVVFDVPCIVEVSIFEPSNPKQRIYQESRPATIQQYLHDGRTSTFEVQLKRSEAGKEQPFLIELERLFTVTESGNSGSNGYRWKRTITTNYVMEVTIRFWDSCDSEKLLARLESDPPHYLRPNETILTASWDQLPTCPQPGDLVPLKRTKGHKGKQDVGKYQLEIMMGWQRRKDAPLKQYNKFRTSVDKPDRQLPTPTASENSERLMQQTVVVYRYQEGPTTRTKTMTGLLCPLCPNLYEHPSFDRLRLHCAMYHDHFHFELVVDGTLHAARSSAVQHTVDITLPTDVKQVNKQQKDIIDWVAPQQPFNVAAWCRGHDEWMPGPQSKAKEKRGRPAGGKAKDMAPSGAIRNVRKRPAPDDVEDLPEHRPRKQRVPNVQDVNFYHRSSKQRIEPGSLVSDSDEEIDEYWLAQKNRYGMVELGVGLVAAGFKMAFETHMQRERPESSLLLREALVRFMRNYDMQLRDAEWQRLLADQLLMFHQHRIVDRETVDFCLERVQNASEDATLNSENQATPGAESSRSKMNGVHGAVGGMNGSATSRERKKWSGGKFVSRDSEEPRLMNGNASTASRANGKQKINGQTNGLSKTKGLCTCGKSARGVPAALACADPVCHIIRPGAPNKDANVFQRCVRRDYHLACVGLEKRVAGWRCPDCSV